MTAKSAARPRAEPAPAAPAQRAHAAAWRGWRWLGWLFMAVVSVLVARLAWGMDWAAAFEALRALPLSTLAIAGAFAAASHVLYAGYDLIGRHQTRHRAAPREVAKVGFVSYAFNLNLGALVGGVAFRYKLYARLGLDMAVVTQVVALSMLTNWLGYLLLAGGVLLLAPPALPPDWGLQGGLMPAAGALLWLAVVAYVLLCAFMHGREWHWRGHTLRLPSLRLALLQLGVSALNWLLIAAIIWTLLQHRIPYAQTLGVLMMAAVAGVLAHVPAGLGVLEAVFIALLGAALPVPRLLGALLAYRVLYYVLPLALAGALLLLARPRARSARKS